MNYGKIFVNEMELKNEISYKNTPVLKYSIKYPCFASTAFRHCVDRLNQYYCKQAYSLAGYCEGNLYNGAARLYDDSVSNGFPFHEYEFMSEYFVSYNQEHIMSLYSDLSQYTGGANGTTCRRANSWNLKTCSEIELSQLLHKLCPESPPSSLHLKDFIVKKVNEEIGAQIKDDPGANYFADYEKLVDQYFDPKNFYLSRSAVSVFFQEITIAPHSSGIPVFDISLDTPLDISNEAISSS